MNTCRPLIRRIAAHHVVFDGEVFSPGVVELEDGQVVRYYALKEELPFTEWMEGTIDIVKDVDERLVALLNGTKKL